MLSKINNRQTKKSKAPTKKEVRQMIQSVVKNHIELKYWAVTTTLTNVNSSGVITDYTLIPQGDSDSTRDGDEAFLKHMSVRGAYFVGTATTVIHTILLQWFPNNVPSVTSILLGSASTQAPLIGYNRDQQPQYKILAEKTDVLIPASSKSVSLFHFEVNLSKKSVQFIAGTTAGTNHIYLITISDVTAATLPQFEVATKLDFYD